MIGNCKLCLLEKELINRSHLFPNFMYKGIGDEKNRMNVISSTEPERKVKVQSGAYEEHILCADCDNNILSKLERYANNNFYALPFKENNSNFKQVINQEGAQFIHCTNIDYNKFKLFLESLIWRASVSTHKLFQNFKLTSEQEEQLRNSILNSTPLDEDEFASEILTHQDDKESETDLVFINTTKPTKVSFFINQFIYLFHLDKNEVNDEIKEITLSKKNEMGVIKLPPEQWAKIRKSVFAGIAKQARKNLK
jgi:hypothetical protein